MSKKRARPEEIVAKLRQADVLIAQGQSVVEVIRMLGVSEVIYYRWRRENAQNRRRASREATPGRPGDLSLPRRARSERR